LLLGAPVWTGARLKFDIASRVTSPLNFLDARGASCLHQREVELW
jgi:hypothetical protein